MRANSSDTKNGSQKVSDLCGIVMINGAAMKERERKGITAEHAEPAEISKAQRLNRITDQIIGAAMKVHRALGPGLLESAYEACLAFELAECGCRVVQQQPLPIVYGGVRLSCGYRMDLVVENDVIVEVKSVARIDRIHEAPMISYLRLGDRRVGLLINFNVRLLKDGVKRFVNDFPKDEPLAKIA